MGHTLPQRTRWALTELMTRLLIEHTGGQICAIGGAAPMITEKIGPQHRERKAVLYTCLVHLDVDQTLGGGSTRPCGASSAFPGAGLPTRPGLAATSAAAGTSRAPC